MKADWVFTLDHAGWPAFLVDGASVICRANEAAVKMFGTPLEGASPQLSAIWSPDNDNTADQFLAQWERSPVPNVSLKFRSKGGSTITQTASLCAFANDGQKYFIFQLFPDKAAATAETKSQGFETTFHQKQKLDCALQMARTVALDFNNALTSILGHTSLVLAKMEPANPWRGSLLEVERAAGKAAEVANDLGAFSRQEKDARTQAAGNLNLVLQRTVEGFQRNSGTETVEWKLQFERELFTTKFEEAKMQQALARILENAVEALPHGGRINIQTKNVELAERSQDRNVQLAAGAYVTIEISDTGEGIPADILPRVFEPFFTTKRGNHRGLGLAWVYGVVTNHGGGVAISSQPSAGTSVRIYLPAEKRIVQDNGIAGEDLNGQQTVLIVDDEDLVLTLGHAILSTYGYQVLTANSGQKALDLLSENQSIELVITDLVMPVMSGRELVEQIRHVTPSVPVLCMSGYIWPSGQAHETPYLQKPFTARDLLLKVKQVLAV
jgi:two-component system cell cycle sensor histidine kinase/response regulator CckA